MMRSLFSGVSGLKNHQTRMDVIGNNIANVNTVGFKSGSVTFQDVLSQTVQGAAAPQGNRGGVNPMQIGLGMGLASIDTNFTDGSFEPTGKQTDLSIKGQGFFVLSDGGNQIYTRAGNFDFDSQGNYLVPGSGYKVMGWMANADATLDTTTPITTIQVPVGATMKAKPSSNMQFGNNLSADAATGTVVNASIDTYDSLGNAHKVTNQFYKTSNNTWLSVSNIENALSSPATTGTMNEISFNNGGSINSIKGITPVTTPTTTATLSNIQLDNTLKSENSVAVTSFDASGNPTIHNITFTNTGSNAWSWSSTKVGDTTAEASGNITWNGTDYGTGLTTIPGITTVSLTPPTGPLGPLASGFEATPTGTYNTAIQSTLNYSPTSGAAPVSLTMDFSAIRQYGGTSTVQATSQNGYAAGTLETETIDTSGIIVGRFSNGQTQNLAQVALSTFNNPGGLDKYGDSLFIKSVNSGEAQVGAAGSGGRGTFTPGTLEMSNVDLATQFSDMIITQRGFQANSKIITTTDEMLQTLVDLKR